MDITPATVSATAFRHSLTRILALLTAAIAISMALLLFGSLDAQAQSAVDYDSDADGLIEVANLAQLNAIRWDLDGDGSASTDDQTDYSAAFPDSETGMGCPQSGCTGYELTADLDFDSDGDGDVDADDHSGDYWDDGDGWDPIGKSGDEFHAEFQGNGHTIANLSIDRSAGSNGLFGYALGNKISNLGLTGVRIDGGDYAGGLAGISAGEIINSFSDGVVESASAGMAGGLVGKLYIPNQVETAKWRLSSMWAEIRNSYSRGEVATSGLGSAGGLVGDIGRLASAYDNYSAAEVNGDDNSSKGGFAGRLHTDASIVKHGYAVGPVEIGGVRDGGLFGRYYNDFGYVKPKHIDIYWDIETTGHLPTFYDNKAPGDYGKTTNQLQTPTANTGIYQNWDTDIWDFRDESHYPVLKADWDDTAGATWQEFGDQDPAPAPVPTTTDYTVTHVRVDGSRSTAAEVAAATKTASGLESLTVSVASDATIADILAAADAISDHSITTGSRYIDADGTVHNFQSGKSTYWLIEAVPQPGTTISYSVTHMRVYGTRLSAEAVARAQRLPSGLDSVTVTVDAGATNADILAAADAISDHSITTGSRYIDAVGTVHNFRRGKSTYWQIARR